jgi:Zn-dependent M28 family amino/carboxypeptidase
VAEGPGINDNGSGSSQDLEIAEQIAKLHLKPQRRIRFAFWAAEEEGLLGSTAYVDSLSDSARKQIALNLNFDMVASPNFARFVYDGDDTETAPPGSAGIKKAFGDAFTSKGLAWEPTPFDGRSDYGPFIAVGIPAGGLFSGAEEIKTPEQVPLYGGTAGEAYDHCYHQACDNIQNLNATAFDQFSDASATVLWQYASSTTPLAKRAAKPKVLKANASSLPYAGPFAKK